MKKLRSDLELRPCRFSAHRPALTPGCSRLRARLAPSALGTGGGGGLLP